MQSNESEWEVLWEPPSFDSGGSFASILAKHPLFVYTCLQLQLLTTEAEWSWTHTCPTKHTHTHVQYFEALEVWQSWVKLIITLLLLLVRLFVLKSGTHTFKLFLPCSLIHLPALREECRVSAMRQRPTNELHWERLGSTVGTLLPSLYLGTSAASGRGSPASVWMNTKQKLSPPGELH